MFWVGTALSYPLSLMLPLAYHTRGDKPPNPYHLILPVDHYPIDYMEDP